MVGEEWFRQWDVRKISINHPKNQGSTIPSTRWEASIKKKVLGNLFQWAFFFPPQWGRNWKRMNKELWGCWSLFGVVDKFDNAESTSPTVFELPSENDFGAEAFGVDIIIPFYFLKYNTFFWKIMSSNKLKYTSIKTTSHRRRRKSLGAWKRHLFFYCFLWQEHLLTQTSWWGKLMGGECLAQKGL